MSLIVQYLEYIANVRRYSIRTVKIYSDVLRSFFEFSADTIDEALDIPDSKLKETLNTNTIRGYEMYLLEQRKLTARTVNLHISVLSGLCRFLLKKNAIDSNPARIISKPKEHKRLPEFYKKGSIEKYLEKSEVFSSDISGISPEEFILRYLKRRTKPGYSPERDMILATMEAMSDNPEKFNEWLYTKRLNRLIVSILYSTGIRRSELISLKIGSIDLIRRQMKVKGKGEKTREIPVVASLCKEISLYLQTVETTGCGIRGIDSPLLVTLRGKTLYPVYVDRAVKSELGETGNITARKSPHVLRHTLATELLDKGADINSIKELLGHSSLAATQIYTHNSVAKLKKVYKNAHPRAKSGGRHGD